MLVVKCLNLADVPCSLVDLRDVAVCDMLFGELESWGMEG